MPNNNITYDSLIKRAEKYTKDQLVYAYADLMYYKHVIIKQRFVEVQKSDKTEVDSNA